MKIILGFVFLIILLPFIFALVFCVINPRKSFLAGRRWQFNGEIEPSEIVLKINRIIAIIVLIFIAVGYVIAIINI